MDENTEKKPAVEVEVSKPSSTSFQAGDEKAVTRDTSGVSFEPGAEDTDGDVEEADREPAPADDTDEGAPEEGDTDKPADSEDLGEFKADDPEVVEKFASRYFTEDNKLNKDALASEFWANRSKDKDAGLNEGTYAFLEHQLGITKETIKEVETGLVAQREKEATSFYAKLGGVEKYNAAIKWAREGGYSAEQQERYRKLEKGNEADYAEAAELLISRYEKATGGQRRDNREQQRRPSAPNRHRDGRRQDGNREQRRDGNPPRQSPEQAFQSLDAYGAAHQESYAKLQKVRREGTREEIRAAEREHEAIVKRGRRSRFTK